MTAGAGAQSYPNFTHRTSEFFVEDSARYSTRAIARFLTTPVITIHGSKASTRFHSLVFHWSKRGPKRRVSIKGATHVDLYDRDQFVYQAVAAIVDYFKWSATPVLRWNRNPSHPIWPSIVPVLFAE